MHKLRVLACFCLVLAASKTNFNSLLGDYLGDCLGDYLGDYLGGRASDLKAALCLALNRYECWN